VDIRNKGGNSAAYFRRVPQGDALDLLQNIAVVKTLAAEATE
jgi:hypothetical protein